MQVLNFNTGINFGAKGNLKDFDPVGFSAAPDDISTWSEASVAELSFRLPPLRHDVRFSIEVFPFLGEAAIAKQGCFVYFNGLFVHYQSVRTPLELTFTVARDLLSPRANRLSFALPDATAPKDLNLGDDLRLLGLSFVKLTAGPPGAQAPRQAEAESQVDASTEDRHPRAGGRNQPADSAPGGLPRPPR
jgi:hypothetical protein